MAQDIQPAYGVDFKQLPTAQIWNRISDDSYWLYGGEDKDWIRLKRYSEKRIYRQVPIGLINGINRDYDILNFADPDSLEVFVNGQLQSDEPNSDYTFIGKKITIAVGSELISGDKILVSYDTIAV